MAGATDEEAFLLEDVLVVGAKSVAAGLSGLPLPAGLRPGSWKWYIFFVTFSQYHCRNARLEVMFASDIFGARKTVEGYFADVLWTEGHMKKFLAAADLR